MIHLILESTPSGEHVLVSLRGGYLRRRQRRHRRLRRRLWRHLRRQRQKWVQKFQDDCRK